MGKNCAWTVPVSHEKFIVAKNRKIDICLTPLKPVPKNWYLPVKNKKVLGLASGGGQQCQVFVTNSTEVTVFDISSKQLVSDKLVAEREGYNISLIKGDMTPVCEYILS